MSEIEGFWIWRRRGPFNDGEWRLATDEAALTKARDAHPDQLEIVELEPVDRKTHAYNARQA